LQRSLGRWYPTHQHPKLGRVCFPGVVGWEGAAAAAAAAAAVANPVVAAVRPAVAVPAVAVLAAGCPSLDTPSCRRSHKGQ